MEIQTHEVGEQVKKFCKTCNEQLVHMVQSLTKQGKISRVKCARCGTLGMFKLAATTAKLENLANRTGTPYEQSMTYFSGQFVAHPKFGTGEVITTFNTKTIDVLFMDQVRRLVHSRVQNANNAE